MISDNKKDQESSSTMSEEKWERAPKPAADKTSTTSTLNHQFSNPDDPTERNPTSSSDQPISGKIQR